MQGAQRNFFWERLIYRRWPATEACRAEWCEEQVYIRRSPLSCPPQFEILMRYLGLLNEWLFYFLNYKSIPDRFSRRRKRKRDRADGDKGRHGHGMRGLRDTAPRSIIDGEAAGEWFAEKAMDGDRRRRGQRMGGELERARRNGVDMEADGKRRIRKPKIKTDTE